MEQAVHIGDEGVLAMECDMCVADTRDTADAEATVEATIDGANDTARNAAACVTECAN